MANQTTLSKKVSISLGTCTVVAKIDYKSNLFEFKETIPSGTTTPEEISKLYEYAAKYCVQDLANNKK